MKCTSSHLKENEETNDVNASHLSINIEGSKSSFYDLIKQFRISIVVPPQKIHTNYKGEGPIIKGLFKCLQHA